MRRSDESTTLCTRRLALRTLPLSRCLLLLPMMMMGVWQRWPSLQRSEETTTIFIFVTTLTLTGWGYSEPQKIHQSAIKLLSPLFQQADFRVCKFQYRNTKANRIHGGTVQNPSGGKGRSSHDRASA
jgi:hypothetical protein